MCAWKHSSVAGGPTVLLVLPNFHNQTETRNREQIRGSIKEGYKEILANVGVNVNKC